MNNFELVEGNGYQVRVYDFGEITLHVFNSQDAMKDQFFILEKDGQSLIIESPCFVEDVKAAEDYVKDHNVQGALLSYHLAGGGSFLKGVTKYATQHAVDFAATGGKAMIDGFSEAFGDAFDTKPHSIDTILEPGEVNLVGFDLKLVETSDTFNIEIPAINVVYTHMLGSGSHSIVASAESADAQIEELQSYIDRGFDLILTSHEEPETLEDAKVKIAYLKKSKSLSLVTLTTIVLKKLLVKSSLI